ncbi:hypothetical protein Taro_014377 [Colocasia esculenta]|uniref:Glycosyltransferase 61 catalytic domain-containing protein n=1 Tax=Colocasia esculenta TaxID=4460 RepID=A0A843UIW0_COLES|nr:hypothetical protein [Colocasia esculenta]
MMKTRSTADERGLRTPLSKQRSFSSAPGYSLRGAVFFLVTFIVVLVVLQIQALKRPELLSSSPSPWDVLHQVEHVLAAAGSQATDGGDCGRKLENARSRLRDFITFLPLKNLSLADKAMVGTTWFMSSLNDTFEGEDTEHLHFPSDASQGRLLCIAGNHTNNGTMNFYALAWPDALPRGAVLLPGLTFVSDTYYDYGNLWHGLAAVMPFFRWHLTKNCVLPERWVLYHWGELRTSMGYWVRTLTEIALGQEVRTEDFAAANGRPACFEEAVVFRHNEGVMSPRRKREVYDMLRCKARAFCNFTSSEEDGGTPAAPLIRLTLLLRTGARSFKNESTVIDIFKKACSKFEGCRFTVAWADKLETFCDQVRTLSATDVLVSPHGAQLTNMFFMDQNSSVMEFFPKGWHELAGPGQYVYHWLAGNSGMRHPEAWRDPNGVPCPFPGKDFRCFSQYFKDQQLGHDQAHFANWTATVLSQTKEYKLSQAAVRPHHSVAGCACG